jgi:hypothetical protein
LAAEKALSSIATIGVQLACCGRGHPADTFSALGGAVFIAWPSGNARAVTGNVVFLPGAFHPW